MDWIQKFQTPAAPLVAGPLTIYSNCAKRTWRRERDTSLAVQIRLIQRGVQIHHAPGIDVSHALFELFWNPETSDSTTNLVTRALSSDGKALICSRIS
jgi:hypothetical protein